MPALDLRIVNPDGQSGVLPAAFTAIPPAPSGAHGYFDSLVSHPAFFKGYSLRPVPGASVSSVHYEKQLLRRSQGGYAQVDNTAVPLQVTYSPSTDTDPRAQDAAKMVITNTPSLRNQVWLPFGGVNGATYLVTFDLWWGAEWVYSNTNIATYKTIQIAQPSGSTSPCAGAHNWYEVQHRFSAASGAGSVAKVTARSYFPPADPIPAINTFQAKYERWTRYWILIDRTNPASSYVSQWVADTQTDAVQIVDRYPKTPCNSLNNIWIEFNTSSTISGTITRVCYLRNFAILLNEPAVTSLLIRPV